MPDKHSSLKVFHPALSSWFSGHLGTPTEAQAQAWPAIAAGHHTLIAAPTGSGKTLAAFYAAINRLVELGLKEELKQQTYIVYVSPLKALSNDIHRNLSVPLTGIGMELEKCGDAAIPISVAVRTGDTESRERQRMFKTPPHILVTTPESLYLLLTSGSGRKMLQHVDTLIIDEIHAVLADKRGSHLSLSIERLEALTEKPLQRIGLSATQKPLDLVARFLVGMRHISKDGTPDCVIVNTGHQRKLDLALEVPNSPLTAVMSAEVWTELYARLVTLIDSHRTTLVFVNTRRLAERLARALAERIGAEHVTSHHGSMSKEHRHRAEQNLKEGKLKVLVATASMELGIDIGSVDLVVQFASPKRISAFLQRVGRSGHQVGGTSKGIIFPLSRDELVECTALLDSVRRGELDRILMPEAPLDILSQHIVAEIASKDWTLTELHSLFTSAYPFRNVTEERFIQIVRMLDEGYTTKRGRKGKYVHYDALNGRLRGRGGARLAALTNGGSIPDMFDYEVVLQPEGITVGTLNEDFALESLPGDIFTLGTHSWELVKIEGLKVFVNDAAGKPPTIPFWLGENKSRSEELSESVSRLRETIGDMLQKHPLPALDVSNNAENGFEAAFHAIAQHPATAWLIKEVGIAAPAAEQLVAYLWMGQIGLGLMPTRQTLVMERFFDEAGDTHIVIHSPYGSRVNRAWGLALRKKFCRSFNFELQAAADENSIIFSFSSSHSFPLSEVFSYLSPKNVRQTLIQAMLDAPFFEIRWRWNATCSLAVLRNRNGKRVPPHFQRMQSEDLIAQVFPDQIACIENIRGDRQIPDHPLVEQVVHDCLTEAMDIESLEQLLKDIANQKVRTVTKELRELSVFAQEIINARPYAFLDDTEFAQRRVNAIKNRGWLDAAEAKDLSELDPQAIARVREEAWPEVQNADDLHDALMIHGFFTESEADSQPWKSWWGELIDQGRATQVSVQTRAGQRVFRIAAEKLPLFEALFPQATYHPAVRLPQSLHQNVKPSEALRDVLRGRLEISGPVTAQDMADDTGFETSSVLQALIQLETEGFVFRGSFTRGIEEEEWCERRLLHRIHKYTLESLRESIKPVSLQVFMRFLFDHHGIGTSEMPATLPTLEDTLEKLEGYEAPATAWEADILPARLSPYDPSWLDMFCMSGKVVWGRFHSPQPTTTNGKKSGPIKSTPICIVSRNRRPLWHRLSAESEKNTPALHGSAQKIHEYLQTRGASFFTDIVSHAGLLPTQTEEGIAELVNRGLAVSDNYAGLRALLKPSTSRSSIANRRNARAKRKALSGMERAGRWSLIDKTPLEEESKLEYEALEELAFIYLKRWGILFRSLIERESFAPPWRILVRVLRRLELRGELRGGRFVSQVSGEQFALPETVERLRTLQKTGPTEQIVSISAADPLNLVGTVLPGKRIARLASHRIAFKDGIPIAALEGKEVRFLQEFSAPEAWEIRKTLIQKNSLQRFSASSAR